MIYIYIYISKKIYICAYVLVKSLGPSRLPGARRDPDRVLGVDGFSWSQVPLVRFSWFGMDSEWVRRLRFEREESVLAHYVKVMKLVTSRA